MTKKSEPRTHRVLRFINYVRLAHPEHCYRMIYGPLKIPVETFQADIRKLLASELLILLPYRVSQRQVLGITPQGSKHIRDDFHQHKPEEYKRILAATELITRLQECGLTTAEYPYLKDGRTRRNRSENRTQIQELCGKVPRSWQLLLNNEKFLKVLLALYPYPEELQQFANAKTATLSMLVLSDLEYVHKYDYIELLNAKQILL
jgi:hypothetical protein